MKTTLLSIILLVLLRLTTFAQSPYAVKGHAVDTTEKKSLRNATIMVLNAKDSILQKFTRVNADGSFIIDNLSKGKFVMIMSYPDYADYSESFELDDTHTTHDFGRVNMLLKARLLQDVIVKGEVTAIKIKGDTTEFNAKAYVVQPNAKVEDLLKQLPGIQIDKNGKITAQGQEVKKVLVDGEEFFGDDPTLVTKNIRADMVDKVQLFDKKSDQATFTGIDDGEKTKTINIKLRADKKNGYFGKVDAGVGTDDYYHGQLLFNKFNGKKKFSAYATTANTGETGLNWEDNQKYGDSGNVQVMDGGGIYISGNGNDLNYNGQGIPVARTGGLHFDDKWNSDKQSLNANYKIGYLDIVGDRNTLTQNNLPGSVINSTSDQHFDNSTFRQKLDGTYQITLDTSSNLKLTFGGTYKNTKSNTSYLDVSRRGNDTLLNSNNRTLTNDGEQHIFNASAFYTKKLKKKGRTLSVLLSEAINNSDNTGYLLSHTNFYGVTGSLDSVQNINQYKTGTNTNHVFNSNITYTEPLSKTFTLTFNYGLNLNNSVSDQKSFNQAAGGAYTLLDTSLSNHFKFDQLSNQVGVIFNYNKGKTVFNFGTRASDVTYKQIDGYTGDVFKRHFINWNPQASYQYKFSQQQSIRLNYNGNTSQPNISQIQPVKNNNDPLNVLLGNPGLKPSFTNSINGSYNSYKVLSGQNIYLSGNYAFTTNQIVSNTNTDAAGKTTSQYFNLGGKTPHSYSVYGGTGQKIKGPDIYVGLNGSINSNISYNMTNNVLNTSNSSTYSGGLNINKYVENKYDFYVSFGPRYNVSESSLQKDINNNSRGFYGYSYTNVYLPAKFQLSSDLEYTFTGKSETFNQDIYHTNWNITLTKSFLKEKNLKVSAAVNDLLNQNIGFNRSSNGSMITQNSYTTIRRYCMFSVTWDFTKMSGGAPVQK
jgi:hypothetical protein